MCQHVAGCGCFTNMQILMLSISLVDILRIIPRRSSIVIWSRIAAKAVNLNFIQTICNEVTYEWRFFCYQSYDNFSLPKHFPKATQNNDKNSQQFVPL